MEHPFKISTSLHGMKCIQFQGLENAVAKKVLERVVRCKDSDDRKYLARNRVGAFLQGCQNDWILLEFWGDTSDEALNEFIEVLVENLKQFKEDFPVLHKGCHCPNCDFYIDEIYGSCPHCEFELEISEEN